LKRGWPWRLAHTALSDSARSGRQWRGAGFAVASYMARNRASRACRGESQPRECLREQFWGGHFGDGVFGGEAIVGGDGRQGGARQGRVRAASEKTGAQKANNTRDKQTATPLFKTSRFGVLITLVLFASDSSSSAASMHRDDWSIECKGERAPVRRLRIRKIPDLGGGIDPSRCLSDPAYAISRMTQML
jgi:hypothetical protein